MTIEKLMAFVGKENIAEEIEKSNKELFDKLGVRVKRQFDEDLESMNEWSEDVASGLELMKQTFKSKSHPWAGASNYKSPLMSESSIAFGDKASLELLRSRNLVKADIIGRDREGEKKKTSERVTEAMNYQINYDMNDWREEQKKLLYVMPNVGCMFKRTVFDKVEGKNISHLIHYPNFVVNQATTHIDKARSFTVILDVDQNGMIERQNAGIWREVDLYPDGADGDEGSNEQQKAEDSKDNQFRFLEQYCTADLDGDKYEEPYIVTFHEQTSTIMRIVPLYDERSFIVEDKKGRVSTLSEAIRRRTRDVLQSGEATPDTLPETDVDDFKFIRIRPIKQITKYGFIPSPDGTFLDLGYSHLLGALVQGINSLTNLLTDAGVLSNLHTGFTAKGFRKKKGPLKLKPGELVETNISARDLQNSILRNEAGEPSTVLFALLENLTSQTKEISVIVDSSGKIMPNTAPTTALAMIQESLISVSALMGRIIDSESREFQILFDLNKRTFDPELYKLILDEDFSSEDDFNSESLDIKPTANPEMSSKTQRISLATVEMDARSAVVEAGGNPMPIVKGFFEAIGSEKIDEIFPESPDEQQAAEIAKFREAQELENKIQLAQLDLNKLQTEILSREQDRLDADTDRKIRETSSKMRKDLSEIILNLEKAESEDVKNRVSVYTAKIQGDIDTLTAIGAENARRVDIGNARSTKP